MKRIAFDVLLILVSTSLHSEEIPSITIGQTYLLRRGAKIPQELPNLDAFTK